jgi:hypothetical protein
LAYVRDTGVIRDFPASSVYAFTRHRDSPLAMPGVKKVAKYAIARRRIAVRNSHSLRRHVKSRVVLYCFV